MEYLNKDIFKKEYNGSIYVEYFYIDDETGEEILISKTIKQDYLYDILESFLDFLEKIGFSSITLDEISDVISSVEEGRLNDFKEMLNSLDVEKKTSDGENKDE